MKIEISKPDLLSLIGKNLTNEQLIQNLKNIKADANINRTITLEIADINRPDLWSTEGIARELKAKIGKEKGIPKYKISQGNYVVNVNNKLKNIRPAIACAVIKNLKLSEEAIKQLIQLQEKLCENFGRKRKEAALGIYDFDKIKWPIHYTTTKPNAIKFTPLEMQQLLTPAEILKRHEKGQQYKHLLENFSEYPLLIDAAKQVLSMPPIINSDYTGKVTQATKNVFVEVTGYNLRFILPVLNIMTAALAERGGEIYQVKIKGINNIITPDFKPKKISLLTDYCNKILGTNLTAKEITNLLEKSRFNCEIKGKTIEASYLPYRQDIMDERDLIEEVAISYDYTRLKDEMPEVATIGKPSADNQLKEKITSLLTGLGFQEILTFILTNKEQLKKTSPEEAIEIENPVSLNYNTLKNSLLPSALNFLSNNTTREFPQKIFEIGECYSTEQGTKTKLIIAISSRETNFTEIKQILDYLAKNLNTQCAIKQETQETKENSEIFIEGRAASIIIKQGKNEKKAGIIGELSPKILSLFNISMPTTALEIDLQSIS